MKIKLMILFLLITGTIFSQGFRKHQWGPKERMEQLEQVKLLEVLNFDEETSVRFIARRNSFKEGQAKIMDERESLTFEMEQALSKGKTENDFDYAGMLEKLASIEKKFVQHRIDFVNSMKDILTTEQIAKLVVFESKFMREVRDALMRRGGVGPMGPGPNPSDKN